MKTSLAAKLRGMSLPPGYNAALLREAADALAQAERERDQQREMAYAWHTRCEVAQEARQHAERELNETRRALGKAERVLGLERQARQAREDELKGERDEAQALLLAVLDCSAQHGPTPDTRMMVVPIALLDRIAAALDPEALKEKA